jgi:phage repressor protein C with HTH and peptisase S24 domain
MSDDDLDPFVKGLQVAMAAKGWKAAPLATASGLGISAVRDLFRAKAASPKVSTAEALAKTLGMTIDEVIDAGRGRSIAKPHPVAVVGRVGAGAKVPLADAYEKGDGLYHVARPPQIPANGVAAVEVEGDSMAPMYQPGHVLFFRRHADDAVLEDDIGKPCIIEDAEGMAWVKLLKRGSEPGRWNLVSLNPAAESVWDAQVKWAARVLLALPAELVEVAG